jgi:hypothetical protein
MWPGIERQRCQHVAVGQMMLESGALLGWQRNGSAMQVAKEVIFAVANNPVAKNQIMHPAADIDRVNLNKTKVR